MGRAAHTPESSITLAMAKRINELEDELEALRKELALAESMHRVAIQERNLERHKFDKLMSRIKRGGPGSYLGIFSGEGMDPRN